MKKAALWAVVFFAAGAAGAGGPAGSEPPRHVDVRGEGLVSAAPDMAVFTAAIETEAPRAAEAQRSADAEAAAVLKALAGFGIKEPDVRTLSYQLLPKEVYKDGQSKRIGYQVASSLEVRVKDLSALGRILDAVLSAGADRIASLEFEVKDREKWMEKARAAAAADARRKAEQLCRELGASLGGPLAISEETTDRPGPVPMMKAMLQESANGFPVAPGESEIRVRLFVSFEIR